jgi:hypothetical protein
MPDLGNTSVFFETDASNNSGTMPSWNGAAAPSTLDDAGRALQGAVTREWTWRSFTETAGGTANAKTVTYAVAPADLYTGQKFAFIANTANSATCTLNINSLGAKTIKKDVAGVLTELSSGDMATGQYVEVTYNGTDFIWTNWQGLSSSAASATAAGIVELATTVETLTGTDATRAVTPAGLNVFFATGASITDGAAITIGNNESYNLITSTTAITSFVITTDFTGRTFKVRFDTARTLAHNGTSLILPGGANITTAQGDIAQFRSLGSGNVVCEWYTRADGTPIKPPSASLGSIDTSSGASATLGSLVLTNYKFLKLVFNGVSASAGTNFLIGNSTLDDVQFTDETSGAGSTFKGLAEIDLATGIGTSVMVDSAGGISPWAFDSAVTTATTTISVAPASGTLDAGSITVYGIA